MKKVKLCFDVVLPEENGGEKVLPEQIIQGLQFMVVNALQDEGCKIINCSHENIGTYNLIQIISSETEKVIFEGTEEATREYIMFTLIENKLGYTPQIEVSLDSEDPEDWEIFIHSCTWDNDKDLNYTPEQIKEITNIFPDREHDSIKNYLNIHYVFKGIRF